MQLDAVFANARDQDQGREMEIVSPFDGTPTGLKMTVVGPDSETAHRARLALADELAEMADSDGRVSAENREKARVRCLARHVIRWNAEEDGKLVPFAAANVERVLRVGWIGMQVDAWASDRRNFGPRA